LPIYVNERRALDKFGLLAIKPSDIEEIRYINCFDKSIATNDRPHEARFYVTLKAGLLFDQKRGPYRPDSAAVKKSRRPPAKRGVRRLDVVDAETRAGVGAASVVELRSGRSSTTDGAGQVLLDFAESTTVLVSVRRTGYVPAVVVVQNGVVTKEPMTVSLVRRGPGPVEPSSQVRVTPTSSADTVAKLSVVGFYARLNDAALPSSAFITADQLRTISTWSALDRSGLRSLCADRLFIDGVQITTDSGSPNMTMLDSLVSPSMVSGIETYVGPEVGKAVSLSPAFFSDRGRGVTAQDGCATALWTK